MQVHDAAQRCYSYHRDGFGLLLRRRVDGRRINTKLRPPVPRDGSYECKALDGDGRRRCCAFFSSVRGEGLFEVMDGLKY